MLEKKIQQFLCKNVPYLLLEWLQSYDKFENKYPKRSGKARAEILTKDFSFKDL